MRRRVKLQPIFSADRLHAFLIVLIFFIGFTLIGSAQEQRHDNLPEKIRGYKVHKERIVVTALNSKDRPDRDAEVLVSVGDPYLAETTLTGVTFALPVELTSIRQSGKVDFITFYNVRVNGIPVSVEEYRDRFEFRRGESASLPEPVAVFLPTGRILQAAWLEMRERRSEWSVTGRVFVFGKFRRFGLFHKRVVPIDFDLIISNPLRTPAKDEASVTEQNRFMIYAALR
jgi:hypothetical protein